MRRRVDDPLRRAWLGGDWARVCALLEEGRAPLASTARKILAPRSFLYACSGIPVRRKPPAPADSFGRASALLAARLPLALQARPDILRDMLSNGSLLLLASALATGAGRVGHSIADEEMQRALEALSELVPGLAASPILMASFSGARPDVLLVPSADPLWMAAGRLGPRASMLLLGSASAQSPLDPLIAFRALVARCARGSPECALTLAQAARAPSPEACRRFCCELALSGMDFPRESPPAPWLAVLEAFCRSHADMPGALSCEALVGSPTPGVEDGGRSASIPPRLRPAPFGGRFPRRDDAQEALRARWMLDWFEGGAKLAAKLGLPDMADPLANGHLSKAYAGAGPLAGPHPFPTGLPSLPEAFNARKLAFELGELLPEGDLPSRRSAL